MIFLKWKRRNSPTFWNWSPPVKIYLMSRNVPLFEYRTKVLNNSTLLVATSSALAPPPFSPHPHPHYMTNIEGYEVLGQNFPGQNIPLQKVLCQVKNSWKNVIWPIFFYKTFPGKILFYKTFTGKILFYKTFIGKLLFYKKVPIVKYSFTKRSQGEYSFKTFLDEIFFTKC